MDDFIEICDSVRLIQSEIRDLYASNNSRKFGSFIPEQFRVELHFDISEINSFEKNDITKGVFRQTWVHEYVHLFQSLTMPKFSQVCQIMRNKQKVDAGFLLYAIQDGVSWNINSEGFIDFTDIIMNHSYVPPDFVKNEIKRHYPVYDRAMKDWVVLNNEGISNIVILEGMAHIFSIAGDPLKIDDDLGLGKNTIYTVAYQFFLENGGDNLEGDLNRVSFFSVLCYFSFFPLLSVKKESPRDIFVCLCENWMNYYSKLRNESDKSRVLNDIGLIIQASGVKELEILSENKSAIEFFHMFYGLIDFINSEVGNIVFPVSNEFQSIRKFALGSFDKIDDCKLFFYFLRFPSLFIDWTDKIRRTNEIKYHLGKSSVTIENDQDLMKFVQNFWYLINANAEDPWCCPDHDFDNRRNIIRKCKHIDSFSSICYDLTGRKLDDIVRI